MNEFIEKPSRSDSFAPKCLSIDLEIGVKNQRIYQFAAVRGDSGLSMHYRQGDLLLALNKLDAFAEGLVFLLGHNIITFDVPHLAAAKPDLHCLKLPVVDTLRLNPLAFPANPYHHLVKHYQDGQLKSGRINDPELDARLTLDVFHDQLQSLKLCNDASPDLVLAWHWLTTVDTGLSGLNAFFSTIRRKPRPTDIEARRAIETLLEGRSCQTSGKEIIDNAAKQGWELAYTLAWLSVAGGNSVMPPWVRHQFPEAGKMVRLLRDTACNKPRCTWCSERHNAHKELKRWFGWDHFRPEPADENGRPLQQAIVESAMRGEHVLGILPTGTGKSLCYQIPALSRYDKTGVLTVVISPLVALMADQVAGLEAKGISSCAALNGLLSMPERADVLDRVRLGNIAILIVSPEQLRNRAFRKVLAQREIGSWVLDEAHCISKWGADFRPDYRYVSRFIKEKAGNNPVPPVLCLTATAKPDVVADILGHFRDKVGIELKFFDGGASRSNLEFSVVPTTPSEKFAHIFQILQSDLPPTVSGGAIVYCATRRQTEEVAAYLREKGLAAAYFHAALPPETKKHVQLTFIQGDLRVIAATNAFGMGIDKPDVRLVIHADIPGSLENYLQESGRAGRDSHTARCVLLYTQEDIERQFSMSSRSRLTQRDIQSVLKSIKRLDRKKRFGGTVVATVGEILTEDVEGVFERDSATDDTRVRTAIAWLEESVLLTREENAVQVFPSSLQIASMDEARAKLIKGNINDLRMHQLLALIGALIEANADEGISTDELMSTTGLNSDEVRSAFYDLEKLGIARNDTVLTAFVHAGVAQSSQKRLDESVSLENALIKELRHAAPDLGKGDDSLLQLRYATQQLKDAGYTHALPETLRRIVNSLSMDGKGEQGGVGSLRLKRIDQETIQVTLQRNWSSIEKTAQLRHAAAKHLLAHLLLCLPPGAKGTDLLAETTLGKLLAAIEQDLILKSSVKEPSRLLDRALMWLHEMEIIRLNKGMAVFRPAMTIVLEQDKRRFTKDNFAPLKLHYHAQVIQIHVMSEYVQRGLQKMAHALMLTMDYFRLGQEEFLQKWLPDREKELSRQTTPESWRNIVEHLNNPVQQRIVTDDREQSNVLILAGPGSGKTRVLVHRIAYLVRVKRENPRSMIALAYNRHAAMEIRKRLIQLIGNDAKGVTVMTCHALAMRLVGASILGQRAMADENYFKAILQQAINLLKGDGLPPEEADEQRERLLAGFRWILVDEYQDIGGEQYELISALAGRTQAEDDVNLSLFAVGDDDQNIYAFAGASIEFIRRFAADYAAQPAFLVENYRSTGHIITAANLIISPAPLRMKTQHPITINRARKNVAPGGTWSTLDPVGQGKVQILPVGSNPLTQAMAVMNEFERLSSLDANWNWSDTAVIAKEWKYLSPIRAYCESHAIPVHMADEDTNQFWRVRETQKLVAWIHAQPSKLLQVDTMILWLDQQPDSPWQQLLREAIDAYIIDTSEAEPPTRYFLDWLAEWGFEMRRRQHGLLLLTAHRAKGLEFTHVAVLDGAWEKTGYNEDPAASRRLYYVAMTRAKNSLLLARFDRDHALLDDLPDSASLLKRSAMPLPPPPPELARQYHRLTLKDVDLGLAGRYEPHHAIHQHIAMLNSGDILYLRQHAGRWELLDAHHNLIGRLSSHYAPQANTQCISARVMLIISRWRDDSEPQFQHTVRCDHWEVVIPELVFEQANVHAPDNLHLAK